MTSYATIEIVGVKEALRELQRTDKRARRQLTVNYRKIVEPFISDARAMVPLDAPISGWSRSWTLKSGDQVLPWDGYYSNDNITARVSGKRPTRFGDFTKNLATFILRWDGTIETIYDIAGRESAGNTPQGRNMIAGLRKKRGAPSRVMWPAFLKNRTEIEKRMRLLLEDLMRQISADINR